MPMHQSLINHIVLSRVHRMCLYRGAEKCAWHLLIVACHVHTAVQCCVRLIVP